jgi:hypothetical protein
VYDAESLVYINAYRKRYDDGTWESAEDFFERFVVARKARQEGDKKV